MVVSAPLHANPAGAAVIGKQISYLARVAGLVSMVTDVATIVGDYEEDVFEVQLKQYSDTSKCVYGGFTTVLTRDHWVDPNGASQYRSEWLYLYPDGTSSCEVSGVPFEFAIEQRHYYSAPAVGYTYEVNSQSRLSLGYRATRSPNLRYFLSPDPRPVKIEWQGRQLATGPGGAEYDRNISLEYSAPRNRFMDIPFPESNFQVNTSVFTPRLLAVE
jgi:hypothetical protein